MIDILSYHNRSTTQLEGAQMSVWWVLFKLSTISFCHTHSSPKNCSPPNFILSHTQKWLSKFCHSSHCLPFCCVLNCPLCTMSNRCCSSSSTKCPQLNCHSNSNSNTTRHRLPLIRPLTFRPNATCTVPIRPMAHGAPTFACPRTATASACCHHAKAPSSVKSTANLATGVNGYATIRQSVVRLVCKKYFDIFYTHTPYTVVSLLESIISL